MIEFPESTWDGVKKTGGRVKNAAMDMLNTVVDTPMRLFTGGEVFGPLWKQGLKSIWETATLPVVAAFNLTTGALRDGFRVTGKAALNAPIFPVPIRKMIDKQWNRDYQKHSLAKKMKGDAFKNV